MSTSMVRANRAVAQIRSEIRTDKTPRQSRSRVTRDKIFVSALAILEREGAPGLSVRRLAQESGLSTGAIYNLFSSISAVLYQLYEDRLEQELAVFQETFGSHNAEQSIDGLLDDFLFKDAALGWGKPIDLQLEDAVKSDPNLARLFAKVKIQQRDCVVHALRQHDHDISSSQLRALATYIIEILSTAYDLRHKSNLNEKQYLYAVTRSLIKQAIRCLHISATKTANVRTGRGDKK